MKWMVMVLLTLVGLSIFTCAVVNADNELPNFTTMQEVRDFVMKNGTDKVFELATPSGKESIPYKEWKKGGVGAFGAWTFYTMKASPFVTRIIIYKPDTKSYIILSEETEASTGGEAGFSIYIVTDNGAISWIQWIDSRGEADAFVKAFLQYLPRLIIDKWDYTPNPEDTRGDLCWELKAKLDNAPKEGSEYIPMVIPGGTPI